MKFDSTIQRLLTEMPHIQSEEEKPFEFAVDFRLENFGSHPTYQDLVHRAGEVLKNILAELKGYTATKVILNRADKNEKELTVDILERLA